MKVKGMRKRDIWDSAIEAKPEDVAGVERRNLADALFKSVVRCNFQRVRFMLETGVSARVVNDDGQNLLVASLYIQDDAKRDKMFQLLMRKGADPCVIDTKTGRDVLGWAAYLGRAEQVQYILESVMGELDLQRRDFEGMTPLHHAVICGHTKVVEILVANMTRYGLNIDTPDVNGLTPYIYARRLARNNIASILVEKGNCSTHQLDSVTFRSADEWETIGRREKIRKERERQLKEKHSLKFKKLTPICSKSTPRIAVSFANPLEAPSVGQFDDSSKTTTRNSSASVDIDQHEAKQETIMRRRKVASLVPIPALSLSTPSPQNQMLSQSLDTASALIALSTPARRPNSREIEKMLIQSARSEGEDRTPIRENLCNFLDLVAAQKTPSFREPVKPPTPEDVPDAAKQIAAMFGSKKGRHESVSQRKSVAAMSSILNATSKFAENMTEKKRRKTLALPTLQT